MNRTAAFSIAALITLSALAQQDYPAPYPRPTAQSILQNDRVNIWSVTWPRGYATPMHEHYIDQLSITLVPGTIRLTTPGRAPTESSSKYASVTFVRHGTVHQEEGTSDVPQHKIMLEVKPSPPTGISAEPPASNAVKLLDNDRLIAWDYTWPAGRTVQRPAVNLDTVTVFLEPGSINNTAYKQGDVLYTPHGTLDIPERATGSPRAIIIQLK